MKTKTVLGKIQFSVFLIVLIVTVVWPVLSNGVLWCSEVLSRHALKFPKGNLDRYAQNWFIASILITQVSIGFTCWALQRDRGRNSQDWWVIYSLGIFGALLLIAPFLTYFELPGVPPEFLLTVFTTLIYIVYIVADKVGMKMAAEGKKDDYRIPMLCVDIPALVLTLFFAMLGYYYGVDARFSIGASSAILLSSTTVFALIQTYILHD